MSNYPCSLVHGGSDPVGKICFRFPNFIFNSPASLIKLGVNKSTTLCEHVFLCTLAYITPLPCNSEQNKVSRLNQTLLHYTDGRKL